MIKLPHNFPPMELPTSIAFYDLSNPNENSIASSFDLISTMTLEDILTHHLLPFFAHVQNRFETSKDRLTNFILQHKNSRDPSTSWIKMINLYPLIPLSLPDHRDKKERYAFLMNLVSPESILSDVFFDDEERNVLPDKDFFQQHKRALIACGIRTKPSWDILLDRIRCFSKRSAEPDQVAKKIDYLFQLPVTKELHACLSEIRTAEWLPGMDVSGNKFVLLSPESSRGWDEKDIVDHVWGIVDPFVSLSSDWTHLLGWHERVPTEVLLLQLDQSLDNKEFEKVDKVLDYLAPSDYHLIGSKPVVLSLRNAYMCPRQTFLPGSLLDLNPMFPHLDEVDPLFLRKHSKLIDFLQQDGHIRQQPELQDLLAVQRSLKNSDQSLSQSDLDIVISSLEIAAGLGLTISDTEILIPDSKCRLQDLSDIVYGDRSTTGGLAAFNFVHPKVSEALINQLGIEHSLARATRLKIEFDDGDGDEFTPSEDLTTVISDTLGRYSPESIFNEYLANADDCNATKISWILDECLNGPHDSIGLLSPDLLPYQGPSLMVYNDQGKISHPFAR